MNIYSYIILIALLLQFLLDNIADALNLKALRHEMPPALAGVYEPDSSKKSPAGTVF